MQKKKYIADRSNEMIKEKLQEGLDLPAIIDYFKAMTPKNNIEKRIVQRSVCILGGNIGIQQGKFENRKLVDLLRYLKRPSALPKK